MRLLHTEKFELEEFGDNDVPHYAILSHTWGKEEITLQDIRTNGEMQLKKGYEKIKKACSTAAKDGFEYIWIDTCCIDKTSSTELSEALNSMFRWYEEAEECYAYLADVPQNSASQLAGITGSEFRASRWFTRGWTLQELIAPPSVIFLDMEWQEIGTKSNLQQNISEITGIPGSFLLGDDLRHASVAQRMSWASKRETTRTEDLAYCLLGIFGIYMPMLYGEGERAFVRLQEEIMKVSDDHSLFAWRSIENHGGILATSPAAFVDSGNIIPVSPTYATSSPSTLSSRGIHLSLRFIKNGEQGKGLGILNCTEIGKESMRLALHLRHVFLTNEDFVKEQDTTLGLVDLEDIDPSQHPLTSLFVRQWHPTRNRKREDIEKCVVKLEGVDGNDLALRIADLTYNCEISDGLIIMNIATIPDGVLCLLLVVCRDGNFFQILLKKYGRSVSAEVFTGAKSDVQDISDQITPGRAQNDQDRVVKVLGNGHYVHVAIKKRVLLLRGGRCLAGVVEVSYSNTLRGLWLEHTALLDKAADEKTLLSYAALRGFETVVQYLLDQVGGEPNSEDESLRTPLSWAAEGGQEAMVKLLLEKGASPESVDKNGRTPLSWAAGTGNNAIMQLLLAALKGNEINVGDRTSLSRTTWKRLLPAKSAKVELKGNHNRVSYRCLDSADSDGRTPLAWAAGKGHEAVVRTLWEHGAELESKDSEGLTPLMWAASNGHEAIVQLLRSLGATLNQQDSEGRTALWWAAYSGHEAVVELLLKHRVEIEPKDSEGRTPLWWAAFWGHEVVVKLLLDADSSSNRGIKELCSASQDGHDVIVNVLLNNGVQADSKESGIRWTPLVLAARNGHEAIVKLLLEKGVKADSASSSKYSLTPLLWAAQNGHEGVVKILLENGAVADWEDYDGRTPLLKAAQNGLEGVVNILLETHQVIADLNDMTGRTPLSWAAGNGHEATVKLLLGTGQVRVDSEDNTGKTPLSWAAKNGHESIVKLLLETGQVRVNSEDNTGQTTLLSALRNRHNTIAKILHENSADRKEDIDSP